MKNENKKTIILLDAHAIIHRAYHALPEFSSTKGEPTGALYGLVAMLLKIIKDLKPDYIAACFDLPDPTFRHEAYEAYKAGRPKTESNLVAQLIRARDIFVAFGIPSYELAGFEADDLLGTIVEKLKKDKNTDIIIASGDMDTMQLVDGKKVRVFTLKKGINDTILYDEDAVIARFGFPPKLMPDYKGLRGDPSDNIIGIPGVGEKTATMLIQSFGTIENIYKALKKNKSEFEKAGIKERMVKLLEEHEEEAYFSKTLAEIRRDAPFEFSLPEKVWRESVDPALIEKLFVELDFRTLNERVKTLLGNDKAKEVVEDLNESKEDIEETAIALWVDNSEYTNPDREDILSTTGATTVAEAKKKILERLEANGLLEIYRDIELPLIPIIKMAEEKGVVIDKDYLKTLSKEYHKELEILEKKIWKHAGKEFNINSPKQLGEILFDTLNLSVKGLKKTEGGARSTRVSELEKLRGEHPIVEEIMAHREWQKLLSTYIDAIPPLVASDGRLHTHFLQAGTTTGRFSSINPNLQNIPIKSDAGRKIRRAFVADKGCVLLALDYSQIELRVAAILSEDKDLIKIFKDGDDVHAAVASRVFGVKEKDVTKEMRRQAKVINFGIIYGMGINALKENLGGTRVEAEEFYNQYFKKFPGVAEYLDGVKTEVSKLGYTSTLFGRRRYFPMIKSPIQYIRASAERMAVNAPIQGTAADIIKIAIKRADEAIKENKLSDKVSLLLQVHDELIYEVKEGSEKEASKIIGDAMEGVLKDKTKNPHEVPILVNVSVGKNWGEMK
ncbi:MAG: DNA polymerase [Candidatus Paceibacterota bacterium]